MSRYRVLREDLKCDILTSGFIAFINYLMNVEEGTISFMNLQILYKE